MAQLKEYKPYRFYVFIQLRFLGSLMPSVANMMNMSLPIRGALCCVLTGMPGVRRVNGQDYRNAVFTIYVIPLAGNCAQQT
jgi:hypothetical protein